MGQCSKHNKAANGLAKKYNHGNRMVRPYDTEAIDYHNSNTGIPTDLLLYWEDKRFIGSVKGNISHKHPERL